MSSISVVIPIYREAQTIATLLEELGEEIAKTEESYEVVLVDDGSPDETWDVLLACAAREPGVRALRLSRNFGKESAIAAGLEHSSREASAVVVMDADLQHPPSLLPEMIRLWREEGADVVEAVKADRGDESMLYRFSARLFYRVAGRFSGFDFDNASDFKLMDTKVVDAWRLLGESNLFFRGMSAWVGFQRVRVPFHVAPRRTGTSRWNFWTLSKLALTGITAFSSFPLRLVTIAGVLFLLASLVWGTRALIIKFQGLVLDGLTTVILLLLIIGSMMMLGLGIIGEYIARIYQEVKLRPRYVVRETAPDSGE